MEERELASVQVIFPDGRTLDEVIKSIVDELERLEDNILSLNSETETT